MRWCKNPPISRLLIGGLVVLVIESGLGRWIHSGSSKDTKRTALANRYGIGARNDGQEQLTSHGTANGASVRPAQPCATQASGNGQNIGTKGSAESFESIGELVEGNRKHRQSIFLQLREVHCLLLGERCEEARVRYMQSVERRDPDWASHLQKYLEAFNRFEEASRDLRRRREHLEGSDNVSDSYEQSDKIARSTANICEFSPSLTLVCESLGKPSGTCTGRLVPECELYERQ